MKFLPSLKVAAIAACLSAAMVTSSTAFADEVKLTGSGASFPFPIYSKWFKDFSAAHSDIRVDYQSKGSGAGIQDFTNKTVDFAASDAAMSDEELAKAGNKAILLPMTAGEVVLVYNLDGVSDLKLPRDVYPEIFAGKITKWNDPKIAAANPDAKLPDQAITVVTRADSSGTSFVFTSHLAAISDDFKKAVGEGNKSPSWPATDKFVKAPKNDGIAATIKQTPGSIGYVEYGFAKLSGWKSIAQLENKAGKYVPAGAESGAAALASTDFPTGKLPSSEVPDLRAWATDPAGEAAYPIASYTWMIFYPEQDAAKAKALREVVEYGLTTGQKSADELGYIPLPEKVVAKVREVSQMIK
ncbi:phosphate ABC transporter substrate-binding protein PstS [Candidatus Thiothrix sp. Deng01]|uniref:Phosphate-binding protein PstS n=1 Tax=Candidatus Thiothrix phosphatis TaxID=3112415 RepID=A0ABU6D1R6_9GAMM|nr:phosphate ABC transporter substrate-binding protein PstS [Candidatus Thiothrix sp. Deng01]MEB4593008.1 phosphate ABC transporter substrate-binding protein PstS [Candidatus Thiothrix sp. Deng01]